MASSNICTDDYSAAWLCLPREPDFVMNMSTHGRDASETHTGARDMDSDDRRSDLSLRHRATLIDMKTRLASVHVDPVLRNGKRLITVDRRCRTAVPARPAIRTFLCAVERQQYLHADKPAHGYPRSADRCASRMLRARSSNYSGRGQRKLYPDACPAHWPVLTVSVAPGCALIASLRMKMQPAMGCWKEEIFTHWCEAR